jgi:hypothetical protein
MCAFHDAQHCNEQRNAAQHSTAQHRTEQNRAGADVLAWWCHTQASACNMPDYSLALLQAENTSRQAFNTWISRSSCLHIQLLLSPPPAMWLLAIRSSQAPASPSVAGVCGRRLPNQQHQAQADWTLPRHQQTRTSGAAPSATMLPSLPHQPMQGPVTRNTAARSHHKPPGSN